MRKFVLTALASAAFVTACGDGAPKTQAELLLGEWDQSAPATVTQQGQTIVFTDGEVEYKSNGTSEGETVMTLGGVPEEMASYKMEAVTSYTLKDGVITDQFTVGTVTPVNANEQSNQLAAQMQAMLPQTPPSSSTILTLTKDVLVLRENTTGVELTYKRD